MTLPATSTFRWVLLLLVIGLGSCQRTSYSFQARNAFYEMPAPRYPDSVATAAAGKALDSSPADEVSQPKAANSRGHKRQFRLTSQAIIRLREHVKSASVPLVGRRVERVAASYSPKRQQPGPATEPQHFRSRGVALIFAFLLGSIGAHLFYLGYHGRGVAYLLGTLAGVLLFAIGVIAAIGSLLGGGASGIGLAAAGSVLISLVSILTLVDMVLILTDNLKPKNGEYYPGFFQTRARTNEPTR